MLRCQMIVAVILLWTQVSVLGAEKVLVEAGKLSEIYDPKVGEKEPWCINDHTFVRGRDGTWHVFGITHILPVNFARDPGKNLLHATARTLTQSPWHKEPFAVTADWDKYGEWFFWAPHVIEHEQLYYMFVCAGNNQGHKYKIHLLTSRDLWHWERSAANPLLMDGFDARDPNILRDGRNWILYYTATSRPDGGNHLVAGVTGNDLTHWTGREVVFTHPQVGTFGGTINVYLSNNPHHWEMADHVGAIYAHASEVVRDTDGQWYISHAGWAHGGLSLAPLLWHDGLDKEDASLRPGA
jgi:beta-fructofuranosidase